MPELIENCKLATAKYLIGSTGYLDTVDHACLCDAEPLILGHLLKCPSLEQECKANDLAELNGFTRF